MEVDDTEHQQFFENALKNRAQVFEEAESVSSESFINELSVHECQRLLVEIHTNGVTLSSSDCAFTLARKKHCLYVNHIPETIDPPHVFLTPFVSSITYHQPWCNEKVLYLHESATRNYCPNFYYEPIEARKKLVDFLDKHKKRQMHKVLLQEMALDNDTLVTMQILLEDEDIRSLDDPVLNTLSRMNRGDHYMETVRRFIDLRDAYIKTQPTQDDLLSMVDLWLQEQFHECRKKIQEELDRVLPCKPPIPESRSKWFVNVERLDLRFINLNSAQCSVDLYNDTFILLKSFKWGDKTIDVRPYEYAHITKTLDKEPRTNVQIRLTGRREDSLLSVFRRK
jgi:hypothetical protein